MTAPVFEARFMLSAESAAKALDVSVSSLQRIKELKPRQVLEGGKAVRYLTSEVYAFAESRPVSQVLPVPESGHGRRGKVNTTAEQPARAKEPR